ncbi:uncharacterized protein LY89DRAFT_573119 [Mollisia scopiformis]|uniref:BTB domain-containing protein n=1 Tax=Mollisia scopiformis TaxID=149040 RepID=A0A194XW80_MOLSC|nr:uncharacterized protein LY89DRAFT_573119 [Mollisia scopiformis]KUJ24555.1 hypothetical protein LY89DRAFT_573119 [Mollisia scopiformis]
MAPPPSRKQKNDDVKSPIVFTCPGFKPDARLMVFDQEFQVLSPMLKLNSAFFRKFFDSPDKAPTNKASSRIGLGSFTTFKYDWITIVDAALLAISIPEDELQTQLESLRGDRKSSGIYDLIVAFEKLLCAIFARPYQLQDTEQLLLMVDLADYYHALPILSRTLDGALINSPIFCQDIGNYCTELFVAAAKLRNALLFRECLIWVVGPHRTPKYEDLSDQKLRLVARCAHGDISTKDSDNFEAQSDELFKDMGQHHSEHGEGLIDYAWWFRDLNDKCLLHEHDLLGLLDNKLVLDNMIHTAGGVRFQDHFFCATISDEELPWDVNKTDW